jgi:hypothetical protein
MSTLATLFTITTYGTWLRGDARGWVEDGVTYPPEPRLEDYDRSNMKHVPFLFTRADRPRVGHEIVLQLKKRLHLRVYAVCVQSWHSHFVTGASLVDVADIVKCAKDSSRYLLRVDRPIWGVGYDKRFCFDARTVHARVAYVERHNTEDGLDPRYVDILDRCEDHLRE